MKQRLSLKKEFKKVAEKQRCACISAGVGLSLLVGVLLLGCCPLMRVFSELPRFGRLPRSVPAMRQVNDEVWGGLGKSLRHFVSDKQSTNSPGPGLLRPN